ncbi:MAG: hypothetical protein AB1486_31635 [Planctomycetota bacterium]
MHRCVDPERARALRDYDLLRGEKKAELEEHLSVCPACRERVRFFELVSEAVELGRPERAGIHPSADELWDYAGVAPGEAGEAPGPHVAEHVASCPECQELLGLIGGLEGTEGPLQSAATTAGVTGHGERGAPETSSQLAQEPSRQEIKRRAARLRSALFGAAPAALAEERAEHRRFPGRLVAAALAIAATLVALIVFAPWRSNLPAISSVEIEILSGVRSGAPGLELAPTDLFRLRCVTEAPGWVYVFGESARGTFFPVVPKSAEELPPQARAGEPLLIPADDTGLRVSAEAGSEEFLILVAVAEPLTAKVFSLLGPLLSERWGQAPADQQALGETLESELGLGRASVKVVRLRVRT